LQNHRLRAVPIFSQSPSSLKRNFFSKSSSSL